MFGQTEITQLDIIIFIHEHVVRFDISMHYSMTVQKCNNSHHLRSQMSAFGIAEVDPSLVDQIVESTLLDKFHRDAELRRFGDGADHEDDIGMAVLG